MNGEEGDNDDEGDSEEGGNNEEVDFEEHPVGTPQEVEETLATGLKETAQQGALVEVLGKYSPEEFNELVKHLSEEYRTAQRRKLLFRGLTLFISVVLVLALFGGLMWFVMRTEADSGALIFFAGTLAGYFMRLASDFY